MAEERSDAGDAGKIIGNAFRHTAFMPQADAAGQPIPAATVIARDLSLEERSPEPDRTPDQLFDDLVALDAAARQKKGSKRDEAALTPQTLPEGQAVPAATNIARDLSLEERSKAGDEFLDFLSGALGGFGGGGLMGRDAEPLQVPGSQSDIAEQAAAVVNMFVRDPSLMERSQDGDLGDYLRKLNRLTIPVTAQLPSVAPLNARDLSLEERSRASDGAKDFFKNLGLGFLGLGGSSQAAPPPQPQYAQLPGPQVYARDVPIEERGFGPLAFLTAIPQALQQGLAPLVQKQRPQTVQAQPMQPYMPYQAGPGGQVAGAAGAAGNSRPMLMKRANAASTAGQVMGGIGNGLFGGLLGPFAGLLGGGGSQGGQQASAPQIQYFSPPAPAPQLPPAPPASGKASRRSRVRRSDNQEPALLNPRAVASALAALSTMSTFPGLGVAERDARGIEVAHEPVSTAVQGNFVSEGNLAKRGIDHVDSGPVLERCFDGCLEGNPVDITTSVSVAPSVKHPREASMSTDGPSIVADGSLHERLVVVPISKATTGNPSTFQTSVITRTVFKNAKKTKTSGKTSTGAKKGSKQTKTSTSTSTGLKKGSKQTKTSTSTSTGARKGSKGTKTSTRTSTEAKKGSKQTKTSASTKPAPPKLSACSRTRTGTASSAPRVHGVNGNPYRLTQSRNSTRVATYSDVQRTTVTQFATRAKKGQTLPKTSTTRSGSKTAKTTSVTTIGRSSSRSGSKIAKPTSVSTIGRPSSRSSSKPAQRTSKPLPSPPSSLNDPIYKTVTLDPNDPDMLINNRIGVRPDLGKKSSTRSEGAVKSQSANADGHESSLEERDDSRSHEAMVESRSDSHDPMEQ